MQAELKKTSRRWTWTLNNYTDADIARLSEWSTEGTCQYLVYGKEIAPTTGTPHLQGYLETVKKIKGCSLLKKIGLSSMILIASNGSSAQNKVYVVKDGCEIFEYGTASSPGKRTDLDSIRDLIKQGASEIDIADAHWGSWLRYNKGFKKYKMMVTQVKRNWFPEIHIFWGGTGLGKTRKVHADNVDDAIWIWNGNHQFYQGYDMQSVCVFDDFYGEINLAYMLKLCDRYPMIVNIKNGECNWQPKKIYFTSNEDPRTWWPEESEAKREAFFRRVRENGGIVHFDSL